MRTQRFKIGEVVRITSRDMRKAQIFGENGAVRGSAQNESGEWSYAVFVFRQQICWHLMETELESVGQFMADEDFRSGVVISVAVDDKGRGRVVDGTA